MHESEQGRVHRTARETFDDKKLAENDHMKVKMSSCISTACLKTANYSTVTLFTDLAQSNVLVAVEFFHSLLE